MYESHSRLSLSDKYIGNDLVRHHVCLMIITHLKSKILRQGTDYDCFTFIDKESGQLKPVVSNTFFSKCGEERFVFFLN